MNRIQSITCPKCDRKSFSQGDIDNRYCGGCHQFHEFMYPALTEGKFIARMGGKKSEWQITSEILLDVFGNPFVWTKEIRRICGRGKMAVEQVWLLKLLPTEKEPSE